MKLSDQIRKAIDQSGMSRYRIGESTGLDKSIFSRFMARKAGLSIQSLDKIGELLGFEIVVRKTGPTAHKGRTVNRGKRDK